MNPNDTPITARHTPTHQPKLDPLTPRQETYILILCGLFLTADIVVLFTVMAHFIP